MNHHFITTNADLRQCCQQASQQGCVALDTEFVWTRTYYPQLGLIQLSWGPGHAYLLDPLAITDPAPFGELLANTDTIKVLHEAASDLPILHRWCDVMAVNVFDTRVAAGFSGISATESLHSLLESLLQVQISKSETRTDWLQRPLTEAQLKYAAEDVIWLPELSCILREKIKGLHNWEWFEQEMTTMEMPDFYQEIKPENSWKRVSGALSLTGLELAILRELAAWREQTAKNLNLAKPRVLRDEQMIFVAQQQPSTVKECHKIPQYWPKSVAKHGPRIVEIVKKTKSEFHHEEKPEKQYLDKKAHRKFSERILHLSRKKAHSRGIDPVVVTARKEVERLVVKLLLEKARPANYNLLQGWRYELLQPQIEQILTEAIAEKIVRSPREASD